MLVDVFLLRREGEKLNPETVQSTPPVRGHLRITTLHRGVTRSPDLAAVTTWATLSEGPGVHDRHIMGLDEVRVTRLCPDGMVIVGVDLVGAPSRRTVQPQAWWCRPVPASAAGAPAEPRGEAVAG